MSVLAALLVVGSLSLHGCGDGFSCGAISRPLDPAGVAAGSISIGFTWLPHARRNAPSSGVIVAAEGGPGYPSGGSRAAYRQLFGPLLQTHDLLMMDDRGTGRSGAIDCRPLQGAPVITLAAVTRCGEELGARAGLYGTPLAADDLDALLTALHVGRVDLYGDSYGTFFVQVFALRHPGRVKSVTLDGAYPAIGANPWYPAAAPAFRHAFDLVCRRSAACAALPGSTLQRIARLLAALRKGHAPVTPAQLAFVMDSAGLDPLAYRELDAAARAYSTGDDVPLRRLVREAYAYEEREPADPREESSGLFAAASCSDNPEVYDMRLPPPLRERAWRRALAQKQRDDPLLYAPFTLAEFLAIPLDFSYVPLCQSWPVASRTHPAGEPSASRAAMPNVPALVLTGDLDTITTPAEGDEAAALFRRAQRIIVANTGHVTAVGDAYGCASEIVRRFIVHRPLDAACADAIPPIRLLPVFARRISQVPPARSIGLPLPMSDARTAAGAVYAAGDAIARVQTFGISNGGGLRGGTFAATSRNGVVTIALHGVRWTTGLPVYGTATVASDGSVDARLHWPGAYLRATWQTYAAKARASIDGKIGTRAIRATMPAP